MQKAHGAKLRRSDRSGQSSTPLARPTGALAVDVIVASVGLLLGSKLFLGLEKVWAATETIRGGAFIACYLYAIGWLGLRMRRQVADWLIREARLLLVISGAVVASALWSFDPKLTVSTSLLFVGTTAIGVFIGYAFEPSRIMTIFISTYLILLLVSVLAVLAAPTEVAISQGPRFDAWMGLQGDKNQLGASAGLALLLFAAALFRGRLDIVPGLVLCALAGGVLVMSKSATALVSSALGLAVLVAFLISAKARLPSLLTYMLVLCALSSAVYFALAHLITLTDVIGRDETLTGRTEIWKDAVGMLHYSPWLGFGYGAVWLASEQSWLPEFATTTRVYDAHSGYLTLATQVGLPVMLLAVAQLVMLSFQSIGYLIHHKTSFAYFAVSFVFWFACYNLTETALYRWNSDEWMILAALMTVIARRNGMWLREQRRQDTPD